MELCKYCNARMLVLADEDFQSGGAHNYEYSTICTRCGFWSSDYSHFTVYAMGEKSEDALLRRFNINDAALGLDELGTYLAKHPHVMQSISPVRFERLVGDVYRNLGYNVRFTPMSRDGGYDLLLFESSTGEQVLVECKRYREDRRVGVTFVRELAGVQLQTGIKKGRLVTSSRFTKPARETADDISSMQFGFAIDLVDVEELSKMLSIYHADLPSGELIRRVMHEET